MRNSALNFDDLDLRTRISWAEMKSHEPKMASCFEMFQMLWPQKLRSSIKLVRYTVIKEDVFPRSAVTREPLIKTKQLVFLNDVPACDIYHFM